MGEWEAVKEPGVIWAADLPRAKSFAVQREQFIEVKVCWHEDTKQ